MQQQIALVLVGPTYTSLVLHVAYDCMVEGRFCRFFRWDVFSLLWQRAMGDVMDLLTKSRSLVTRMHGRARAAGRAANL